MGVQRHNNQHITVGKEDGRWCHKHQMRIPDWSNKFHGQISLVSMRFLNVSV